MTTPARRPARRPYTGLAAFLALLVTGVILICWAPLPADRVPLLTAALSTLYTAWHNTAPPAPTSLRPRRPRRGRRR